MGIENRIWMEDFIPHAGLAGIRTEAALLPARRLG